MAAAPVETALVSDRLLRLEQQGDEHARQLSELVSLVRRLVELDEARDIRDRAALEVEIRRREASAEAEAKRVDVEIEERRATNAWWRERVLPPLFGTIGTALAGFLAAAGAWFSGLIGGGK